MFTSQNFVGGKAYYVFPKQAVKQALHEDEQKQLGIFIGKQVAKTLKRKGA